LDSINCDAGVKIPAIEIQTGVVIVKFSSDAALELIHLSVFMGLARRAIYTLSLMPAFLQLVLSWTANDG